MTKQSFGVGKRLPAARRGSMARGAQAAQIEPLVNSGDLQLSLFDDLSLAEISSPRLPGKRLVACKHRASHHDVDATGPDRDVLVQQPPLEPAGPRVEHEHAHPDTSRGP